MKGLFWDCLNITGLGMVAFGVGLIHWPSALIVAGVCVSAFSFIGARMEARGPAVSPPPDEQRKPETTEDEAN